MTELKRSLNAFRRRMLMRTLGYASMWGLATALVVVIAAPWLQQALGVPLFWASLALPVLLPLIWVAVAWLRLPDERTVVLAGDSWSGSKGDIIAAWELERTAPGSPFAAPLQATAMSRLASLKLPEPRWMRKLLVATLLLLALVPLSRVAHGELIEAFPGASTIEPGDQAAISPNDAEAIEQDATEAAKQAAQLDAASQQQLAEDIAQLAREARAGRKDKESALREANSLVDRAASQLESRQQLERVRENLSDSDATQAMAQALEQADPAALKEAIDDIVANAANEQGIDPERAQELSEAVERAAVAAPQNAELRRASERVSGMLDDAANAERERREQQAMNSMREQGLSEAAIERALETMRKMDQEALRRALDDFCKACNGSGGNPMDAVLQGELSPAQARALAEAGRDLAERLELNAEALREMLQQGGRFEGLEELARKAFEQAQANGGQRGESSSPEWARGHAPEEVQRAWQASPEAGSGGHVQNRRNQPDTEIAPGRTAQVDVAAGSHGEEDPDAEKVKLDPGKAHEESVSREASGRQATSRGIGAEDEADRLPRRFRSAARLYFDR